MKLKNLKKRIARLTASIAKDTKKLGKLQRKLTTASQSPPGKTKTKSKSKAKESKPAPRAKPARRARKKKHRMSPEGRAKLRALMNARWAAKRSGAGGAQGDQSTGNPT